MKNKLYFPRFFYVLKRDINLVIRPIITIGGAGLGVLLILNFFVLSQSPIPESVDFYNEAFSSVLVLGGLIMTSMCFKELKSKNSRLSYLMLPASTMEKMLSMWLLTAVGYALLVWIGFVGFSFISRHLSEWIFMRSFAPFEPFAQEDVLNEIRSYWVAHAIFFLGAVMFNAYAFPKTILSLIGVFFVFAITGAVFFRLIFFEYFTGFTAFMNDITFHTRFDDFLQNQAPNWIELIAQWVVAPFLWVVTYFHLKERTV